VTTSDVPTNTAMKTALNDSMNLYQAAKGVPR
jgi:hypothetical protein